MKNALPALYKHMPVTDTPASSSWLLGPGLILTTCFILWLLSFTPLRVPNPASVELLALVYVAYRYPLGPALLSCAAFMLGHMLVDGQLRGGLDRIWTGDLRRFVVIALVGPAMVLLIGRLKARLTRAVEREIMAGHLFESRQSEERRLRALADSLPALIAFIGRDLRYQFNNHVYTEWFGPDFADLTGRHLSDVLSVRVVADRQEYFDRALAGEAVRADIAIVHPVLGPRTIDSQYIPFRNRSGEIEGFVILGQDVTEQRRELSRQKLLADVAKLLGEAESEDVLQKVVERAASSVVDWCSVYRDMGDGTIAPIAMAAPTAELHRMEREMEKRWPVSSTRNSAVPETLRTHQSRLVERMDEEAYRRITQDPEHLLQLKKLGVVSYLSVPLIARGRSMGSLTMASSTAGVYFNGDDLRFAEKLGSRVAASLDQIYLGRALKASELRFRALFEQCPISIQIFSPDGKTVYVNNAWEILWDAKPELVEDYNILQDPQLDAREIKPLVRRAFAGEPVSAPAHYYDPAEIGKLARPRWIEGYFYPVKDENGQVREVALMHFDVTDRRRTEEELLHLNAELASARDAALEASKAKSAFLANMSHELRTPLNAIIGYSELLHEEASEAGTGHLSTDLEKILVSGQHLLAVISDILDLSKVEAGKMELQMEYLDPAEVASEAANLVTPLVEMNGNAIEIDAPLCVTTVYADRTRLRQVLFNLLSNAAKFTRQGKIHLACRKIEDGDERWAELVVTDTGIGIDQEVLDQLFQAFHRLPTSPENKTDGAGLGLAISRRLTELMGGTVAVSSTLGQGSKFTVRLPAFAKQEVP